MCPVFTRICSNGWTCCREHAGPVDGDVGWNTWTHISDAIRAALAKT